MVLNEKEINLDVWNTESLEHWQFLYRRGSQASMSFFQRTSQHLILFFFFQEIHDSYSVPDRWLIMKFDRNTLDLFLEVELT